MIEPLLYLRDGVLIIRESEGIAMALHIQTAQHFSVSKEMFLVFGGRGISLKSQDSWTFLRRCPTPIPGGPRTSPLKIYIYIICVHRCIHIYRYTHRVVAYQLVNYSPAGVLTLESMRSDEVQHFAC